jgi:hypothetical protein
LKYWPRNEKYSIGLGLWYLKPLSTIFQLYGGSQFACSTEISEEKWTSGLGLIVRSCPQVTRFELINGGLKQTVIQSGKSKPAPSD